MSYVPVVNIEKIKEMLSQGTYSLVDEFEKEILKHILEKETSAMVIYKCRSLVRSAFYITVAKYGKEATLSNFCYIILDLDYCKRVCMELSIKHDTEVTKLKRYTILSCFPDEDTSEYNYCIPVKYLCEWMLDSELIENGLLQF